MKLIKLTREERKEYDSSRPFFHRKYACYAPVTGMYIGIGGNVTSCCVNRTHVLGKYPDQTLEESWFGQKRKELKTCLKKGDFSKGCEVCYHAIRSGNVSNNSALVYEDLRVSGKKYPAKIDFELSNKCNLECIICRGERSSSIRKNREKLPPIVSPFDSTFLEQLKPFLVHLKESNFLGGEPLLIPIYLDIWEQMMVINPDARIAIQTNATILTDRVKRILEGMSFTIAISIDSINKELYEKVRLNGRFDKVLQNIEYYQDYCKRKGTTLSISYTPMTRNWHELIDVVLFCNERQIFLFFNTLTHPRYLAIKNMEIAELEKVIETFEEVKLPDNLEVEKSNKTALKDYLKLLKHWYKESLTTQKSVVPVFDSVDAFFSEFKKFLVLESKCAEIDYVEIRGKVEWLLTMAEDQNNYEEACNFLFNVEFNKLLRYAPSMTKEELWVSFQGEFKMND